MGQFETLRSRLSLLLSGALLGACASHCAPRAAPPAAPSVKPSPEPARPAPPSSASTPTPPPTRAETAVDDAKRSTNVEQAAAMVRATPEFEWLTRLRDGGYPLVPVESCGTAGCEIQIDVAGEDGTLFSFVVQRDGELQAIDIDGKRVPYREWSTAMRAELADIDQLSEQLITKIAALPEIRRFFGKVRANRRRTALWLESPPRPGCRSDGPDCMFVYYVGEMGEDHASRYATVWISRLHQKLFVADIARPEPMPYEQWRKGSRP